MFFLPFIAGSESERERKKGRGREREIDYYDSCETVSVSLESLDHPGLKLVVYAALRTHKHAQMHARTLSSVSACMLRFVRGLVRDQKWAVLTL